MKNMKHCCKMMEDELDFNCRIHKTPWECTPWECKDQLVYYDPKEKRYYFLLHDTAQNFCKNAYMYFCPWCGKKLFDINRIKINPYAKKILYDSNKKIDLIRMIHDKEITVNEAENIIDDLRFSDLSRVLGYHLNRKRVYNLGFSKSEKHAYENGFPIIPIQEIVKLRYKGWPEKICSLCKKKVDIEKLD